MDSKKKPNPLGNGNVCFKRQDDDAQVSSEHSPKYPPMLCFSPLSFLKKIQTQKPSQSFQYSPFPQFHSSENQIDSNKSTAVFNSNPTSQEV